ncbi:phage terminase large subunit [Marinitoga sp. 1137]|uniref:phage terminase large subunit n=1 Tax=Marinitoga sp. 1137 TaxID=1545835 RepID=UPI00095271E0|nr:phage terminase large subunit [Marinitoga sp. 1137]
MRKKYYIKKEKILSKYFKDNFYEFLRYDGSGYWKDGNHLKFLAKKLEEVAEGKIKKLMVFMPPRHGKSELISKKFPAWFLGKYPDKEIIITAYSAELAYDFSRIARETLRRHEKLFGVSLDKRTQAVQHWGIENTRGGLMAAGVGGPITGRGFHVGIIDDPIKNREEANSETIRNKIWDWYRSTFRTRAYPDASIILVLTRWHEDDLAGRLLKEQKDEWEIIELPAIAEEDDVLGRKKGDSLWEERYSKEELMKIKRDIGTFEWLALYQQKPTALDGNIFKREWFQYADNYPKNLRIYQTVDLAISKKDSADYFVILTFGMDSNKNIFILDNYADHIGFLKQIEMIQYYYQKWKPLRIGIESTQYQAALTQYLKGKTALPVKPLRPSADKITRALRITPHFENKKVFILRHLNQLSLLEEQLISFPNGKHDDIVDAVSYIFEFLNSSSVVKTTKYESR